MKKITRTITKYVYRVLLMETETGEFDKLEPIELYEKSRSKALQIADEAYAHLLTLDNQIVVLEPKEHCKTYEMDVRLFIEMAESRPEFDSNQIEIEKEV